MSLKHKCTSIAAARLAEALKTKVATSATSAGGIITLTLDGEVATGTTVKFNSPCDCVGVTALKIDGVKYDFVDAAGNTISDVAGETGGVFVEDALVSVLIDTEQKRAYIQNAAKVIGTDLVDGSVCSELVMKASGWDSTTSRFSFESLYPFASYNIEIQPSDTCSLEQLDAWDAARIVGSATTNTCKAYGEIPAIDIPIILIATKKPGTTDSTEYVLVTSEYSGTAEVTTFIDGTEYDVDNMTSLVDTAPDGSIIITKLED